MAYIATDSDSSSAESKCEESNDDNNDICITDDSDELETELVTDIDNFDLLTSDNYIHVV